MTERERRTLRTLVARLVRGAVADTTGAGVADTTGAGVADTTGAGVADTRGGPLLGDFTPALAKVVRGHLLGPLAYRAGWPGFRSDHAAATIQAERRAAVLAEAVAALGQAGIEVLLLKGVAYAGTLYVEAALRPMSDIDLLVSGTRYTAAIEALGRLGYWHAGTPDQLSTPNHGFTLKRKDGSIDVHRHITHAGRTSIDLDAVWQDARPAPHVMGALRASAPHEYMLHVAHMARHELAVPAINVVDAARLRAAAHRGSRCDLEILADRWRIGRGHRAVIGLLDDLALERSGNQFGIVPSIDEVLAGRRPGRLLQIARKVALTDDVRGVAALVSATVRGRLEHLRARG